MKLYDEAQEVARLKNETVVGRPPSPQVRLRATRLLRSRRSGRARARRGKTFPAETGVPTEIVAVTRARGRGRNRRATAADPVFEAPVPGSWQVPATIRSPARSRPSARTLVNGVSLLAGETVPMPGGPLFVVEAVDADAPPVAVTARVESVGRPEVIDLITADEHMLWAITRPDVAVRSRQTMTAQVSRQIKSGRCRRDERTPERVASADVDLALGADQTPSGLSYRLSSLKPGAALVIESTRYVARGQSFR